MHSDKLPYQHKMANQNFTLSNEEKIALLEELHRPLEEHWSVRTKFGLDAKSSEYIYKHHITRLEDIYTNHKIEHNSTPTGLLYMSPVSQLYGVNGLNVTNDEEKQKRKEEKWVSNFQKHSLNERKIRSSSPSKIKTNSDDSFVGSRKRTGFDVTKMENVKCKRSVCHDQNVSNEDLVMLGLYRFTPDQEEIYRSFVDMISGFDDFDKANILEDVMHEAQKDEDLLALYGGTDLIDSTTTAPLSRARSPSPTSAPASTLRGNFGNRPGTADGVREKSP